MAGHGEEVHVAAVEFQGAEGVDPFAGDAQSTWTKSTASRVEACVRRNRRQDVSVDRSGVGGIRCRVGIRRLRSAEHGDLMTEHEELDVLG